MLAALLHSTDSPNSLRTAFDVLDTDGDGVINAHEWQRVMSTLGDRLTRDEVCKLFKEIDANGDHEIDFNEFVLVMTSQ